MNLRSLVCVVFLSLSVSPLFAEEASEVKHQFGLDFSLGKRWANLSVDDDKVGAAGYSFDTFLFYQL